MVESLRQTSVALKRNVGARINTPPPFLIPLPSPSHSLPLLHHSSPPIPSHTHTHPSSTAITTTNMAAKQNHTELKAGALPHSEV